MEGYICINGNKTLLTPEQIKELGFCEKPVSVQGLALVRDSLRNGTFLKRFKLRDVIEDFGYHFEIIGCCHDRAEEDEERLTVTVMSKELHLRIVCTAVRVLTAGWTRSFVTG